jgi:hypothetical protein
MQPRHHPRSPSSYQHLTPVSPESRELRAAALTRQSGIGNVHKSLQHDLLPSVRQGTRYTLYGLTLLPTPPCWLGALCNWFFVK